jgi:hypothetical protein
VLCGDRTHHRTRRVTCSTRLNMKLLLTLSLAFLLVACANQGGASIDATPSVDTSIASPESTPSVSEEPTEQATVAPSVVAGEAITGVLSAEDIEGGCLVFGAEDGQSYEVIWPDGWTVSPQLELVNPAGEVVAGSGDRITVRGEVATDMGSICQIGQIFEATQVTVEE